MLETIVISMCIGDTGTLFWGKKSLKRPFDVVEDRFNVCFMLVLADIDSRCPIFLTQVS